MPKSAEETKEVCGHINKHYVNPKGRLEDLPCDLEKGHAGDHHAFCVHLVSDPLTNPKGQVIEERYREEQAEAWWSEAAGVPAKDITEAPMPQLSQYQKDILADILKRNPTMSVEVALKQAQESPLWKAV
jgi:hypothetical protein